MRSGSPSRNSTRHVVHLACPPQACNWSILASCSKASTSRLPAGTSHSPAPSTDSFGMDISPGVSLNLAAHSRSVLTEPPATDNWMRYKKGLREIDGIVALITGSDLKAILMI